MKRIVTSALILALSFGAAQAQTTTKEKSKGDRKEHKKDFESKRGGLEKLNLSADQQARLKAVNEDFRKQSEALRKQDNLTVAEMKIRREALHTQHKTQIQSILTQDQKNQLAKSKADFKNKKEKTAGFERKGKVEGDRSVRAGKQGQAFGKELGLTEDQKAKMTSIRADYKSKFEALRNDKSLSQEQKRSKFQDLMKAQQEQIKTVLTKEQVEKMKSARKERPVRNTK